MNIDELLGTIAPKDVRPYAGTIPNPDAHLSPAERLQRELDRRNQQYVEEMTALAAAGRDSTGTELWKLAMQRMGRTV